MLRHFKVSSSIVLSCLLFATPLVLTGCANDENAVVTGDRTDEQEDERDNVSINTDAPDSPEEEGKSDE